MCLVDFAYEYVPGYRLILAANRDEYYDRPTATARFWHDHPDVLAGRDLVKMGTWMGVSTTGRFAFLTNHRNPALTKEHARTRGELVSRFLYSNQPAPTYLEEIKATGHLYNAFNLLAGDRSSLYYYSNITGQIRQVAPGLYGVSNHLLDTPWPKVVKSKQRFASFLAGPARPEPDELFTLLKDCTLAKDEDLPDTGVGLECERLLSSIFVRKPGYGTRTSTVILIDHENNVLFKERTYENDSVEEKVSCNFTLPGN